MTVSAIVAVSENGYIGKENQIPWHLPKDLQYFKKTTLGHPVIMGKKSFLSMGKPLPGRQNIVITRDTTMYHSGCDVVHSIPDALLTAYQSQASECFIIGGGEIYSQTIQFWDKLYLTRVHANIEGDVSFPELNADEWQEISSHFIEKDEKNTFDMTFIVYERLKHT